MILGSLAWRPRPVAAVQRAEKSDPEDGTGANLRPRNSGTLGSNPG